MGGSRPSSLRYTSPFLPGLRNDRRPNVVDASATFTFLDVIFRIIQVTQLLGYVTSIGISRQVLSLVYTRAFFTALCRYVVTSLLHYVKINKVNAH